MYGVVWTTDLLSGTRVTLNTKWYETAGRIIELASPETSKMIVGRSDDTTGLALALDSSGSQTYTVRIMGLNFRGEKGDPGVNLGRRWCLHGSPPLPPPPLLLRTPSRLQGW